MSLLSRERRPRFVRVATLVAACVVTACSVQPRVVDNARRMLAAPGVYEALAP